MYEKYESLRKTAGVPSVRMVLKKAVLCVLVLALLWQSGAVPAHAAGAVHDTKTRAIAIAFDNSGSMYNSENQAWSRATYAMEVFAAMMNEGDILQIYPMGEITAGGKTFSDTNPLEFEGGGDIGLIQDIYTPHAPDTPLHTIKRAHDGLLKTDADERWLVVLTDGNVFYEDPEAGNADDGTELIELTAEDTRSALTEMFDSCSKDMNAVYLGIGTDNLPDESQIHPGENYQYVQERTSSGEDGSAEVTTKLTEICNRIFGRDELPADGKTLTFDLPMKKLIVFVQGSGIENASLTDGSTSVTSVKSYKPHYPTNNGCGNGYSIRTDERLSGLMSIYENVPAGSYAIGFDGQSTSIAVYYEPDVDMAVSITDAGGSDVSGEQTLPEGTYHLHVEMQDPDGNPTASPLLGEISYSASLEDESGNSSELALDADGSAELKLKKGQVLKNIAVEGTYLTNYHITKTGEDLKWAFLGSPAGEVKLSVEVTGPSEIPLSELESDGIYEVRVSFGNETLTGDQLSDADLSVSFSDPAVSAELERGKESYTLKLLSSDKSAVHTDQKITGTVSGSYRNSDGTEASGTGDFTFSIKNDAWTELSVAIAGPSEYHRQFLFLKNELTDDEPDAYTVTLTKAGGEALSDDEIAAMNLDTDVSGKSGTIDTEAEINPGGSGWILTLHGTDETAAGDYTISARVTGTNNVGETVETAGEKTFSVVRVPLFVKVIIALIVLALILTAVLVWLSRKILPKTIEVDNGKGKGRFSVDGSSVTGRAATDYHGSQKSSGSFSVSLPKYQPNPLVKGRIGLTLKAVSPRRVRSAKRHALVTEVPSVTNLGQIESLTLRIGSTGFKLDEETHKLVREMRPGTPVEIDIYNGTRIEYSATYKDGLSTSFGCVLKFI